MRRPPYVVPSRHDPVVATATRVIGGPVGRHAVLGSRGVAGVAAVLVALGGLFLALGVTQKGHCLLKGWSNPGQFWRTCYSDLPVVHVTSSLAERQLPYASAGGSDQPLLSGLVMWLVSLVTPSAGTDLPSQQWVFGTWAVVAFVLLALGIVAGVAVRPENPWHVAHLAASPVLVVLALVSTDLAGIALALWGWWAWTRGRPALSGVLFGLALLVRPFPLLLLAALLLAGLRSGRVREAATAAVAAVLAPLALLLVSLAVLGDGVLQPLRHWWASSPGYGALALVPQLVLLPLQPAVATGIAVAGWVLALGLGAWLTFRSARRPAPAQVAAVMLLVVALTASTLSVQTGLWLLPVLALSGIRWRDHLIFAGAEILHFVLTWMHIGFDADPGRGLPGGAYAVAVVLRLAGWTWVLWQAWRTPVGARPPREPAPPTRPDPPTRPEPTVARRGAAVSPPGR